jgi:glycosyltransferase involved in cell wall biosynthesis
VDPTKVYPVKRDNTFRAEHFLQEKFVIMYSGNVGQTQRLTTVLDAAQRLQDREDIVFMIVGGGVKLAQVKAECERRQLDNVRFLDYQPKTRLAESLSAADLQLVLLDEKLTQLMMPSKLYSALASGTPVLGIGSLESELAQIVISNDAGFFFASDSLDDLVSCIESAATSPERLHEMGVAGRALCVKYFTRDVSANHFNRVLSSVLAIESPELHSRHPHNESHFAPVQSWLRHGSPDRILLDRKPEELAAKPGRHLLDGKPEELAATKRRQHE